MVFDTEAPGTEKSQPCPLAAVGVPGGHNLRGERPFRSRLPLRYRKVSMCCHHVSESRPATFAISNLTDPYSPVVGNKPLALLEEGQEMAPICNYQSGHVRYFEPHCSGFTNSAPELEMRL
ncbi:hypothetical protein AAES_61898 [Amazona aestiva]|uniref:Uncharacterized protein n=1 Tax=Amazona aestiva TaxID=12930 RepID=A0A0Q3MKX2_AMAAE|nr:hypothetical protein AAES_61898 [Amazona aestiva]